MHQHSVSPRDTTPFTLYNPGGCQQRSGSRHANLLKESHDSYKSPVGLIALM